MHRSLRSSLVLIAAVVAAVAFYVGATLPPLPVALDGPVPDTHLAGAYHVHTVRSDGSGTVDEIAAAAARAGLRFVIFTDHGDGTRQPDPPAYRHGVLCIDAVELNTDSGHLVALGLSNAAPYPLAGRSREVVDDIHRLGGVAVVAHPDSPRDRSRWRGQNVPFDGIEWLNADSEWRNDPPTRLAAAALRSLIRPPGAIASLFDRPARTLQRWDAAALARPVFGLAALDVHARIGWPTDGGEVEGRTVFERPSYLAMFRTLAEVAVVERPLLGDAAADAAAVLRALMTGRSFSIVRALSGPAALEFLAYRHDEVAAQSGDRLAVSDTPTVFRARLPHAPGIRLTLVHDGRPVASGRGSLEYSATAPGVYRVEGGFPNASVPWIASNPIVIARTEPADASVDAPAPVRGSESLTVSLDAPEWTVEREPASEGRLTASPGEIQFDFRLAAGAPRGQYAALVNGVRREAGVDRVQFTARATSPMRVSVQVRLPDGQRWRHSAYVDLTPQTVVLRLSDFEPADVPTSRRPIAAPLHSLLFVVDTVNTRPGGAGTFWISDVRLGVARLGDPPVQRPD